MPNAEYIQKFYAFKEYLCAGCALVNESFIHGPNGCCNYGGWPTFNVDDKSCNQFIAKPPPQPKTEQARGWGHSHHPRTGHSPLGL